jgi:hypothetical protein
MVRRTSHGLPAAVPSGSELSPTVAKPPAFAAAGRSASASVAAVAVHAIRLFMPSPPVVVRPRLHYTYGARAVPGPGTAISR